MSKISSFTNKNTDIATMNNLTSFNGYYTNIYREPFISGFAFIFMTKPLLFIDPIRPSDTKDYTSKLAFLNMTKDPLFVPYINGENITDSDLSIVKMLSYNTAYRTSNFMPIFTNDCKSFDVTDLSLEQMTSFETKEGYNLPRPSHSTQSRAANSFTISVTEDANLDFTKIRSLWVNYIDNISSGIFDANPERITLGELDYTSSLYYFLLEPDGRTLKYWSKFTGCWPTSVQYSALRYAKKSNDVVELDLPFSYAVKEDMNPKILEDFNRVSLKVETDNILLDTSKGYSSIKDNPLLNPSSSVKDEKITNALDLARKDPNRDPLVFFKYGQTDGTAPDLTADRFELSFGDNGYKSKYLEEAFEINDKADPKVMSGYWKED